MPLSLVSAWNKHRRSKSHDQFDPWMYKAAEFWQFDNYNPLTKRRQGSTVFTLKEMKEATCSFSDDNLLGKGGFGRVYKGTLQTGEVVAIKKMELPPSKKAEGEREFRMEVDILSRLEHPNLVSFIGYCADRKQRFVVYEYMPQGNLQDHLKSEAKMHWSSRLKVALGAARGLAYLHSSSAVGVPIVHRDFKSTNILLNDKLDAKISDFGLAMLMPKGKETYVSAMLMGTFGYLDPEYTSTGELTVQSDVYAFGMVLLELLTGRRAVELSRGQKHQNLVLQVQNMSNDWRKLRKIIDEDLPRKSYTMESIAMFANLASRCVRIDSSTRPTMIECVKELQLILPTTSKGLGMGIMHTLRMI
ncbi:hypothetical protein Droror1_Dr00018549 [Drosera rotundifolia]